MSNSLRPHRRQPTRLPRPWDSPGKNTGVGCHFLLQCMKVKVKVKSLSRVRLFVTPWTAAHQAPPSMGFSRQEYWSGVPLPSLRNSLHGIKKAKFECAAHCFQNICIVLVIIPRRQWHPTPVLLPRKSHGQRSLVGCSPWGL